MICIPPTPRYILDNYVVDVFEDSLKSLPGIETMPEVKTALYNHMFDRFCGRPIGLHDYVDWQYYFNRVVSNTWAYYRHVANQIHVDHDVAISTARYKINGTVTNTNSGDVTTITESEKMPNVPISETDKYLDGRGKTAATDSSGNNSVSENLVENSDGLSVELLHNVSMALKKLSRMFGDDLEEMFMNRW